ncbi:hypothetical protein OIDMADRAFT_105997 [Oidiodendron maius Zn]|uniref:Zn(2)-C6 fungal-type domain-containing protein n=1 Tax=Oidiodendron maius (strain Zn) TaxID=913774 RepID=A0A0C3GJZ7_OIDMZ|nr:hypothetical protein OIDMADRAFT_105997 [Oidiodendron maius Zn]
MAEAPSSLATEQRPPPAVLKPPRKRRRIVISCTECHRRKQKCDRASPCSNCVARKKESYCHYENEAARRQQLVEDNTPDSLDGVSRMSVSSMEADSTTHVRAFGYAKGDNRSTTMDIYNKIGAYGADPSLAAASHAPRSIDDRQEKEREEQRQKYKSFVRQLPAREYIEKLVAAYFREINHQYYPLDEDIFRENLQKWYDLSLSALNEGPLSLPVDLRFLPALLFQMLALGLQYQPPDYDPALNGLKYASCMSLEDLASDYSGSGVAISDLLGKRHTSLMAVQAGFLRTSYLKNVGMIPESWHTLSSTIRDAQEIGLHKKFLDHPGRSVNATAEETLENLWAEQLRRRMWAVLTLWDIHMAIILGRPSTVDARYSALIMPIDTPFPRNRRAAAPSPRTSDDPPTPLTALIWSLQMSANLWEIYNLEKEGLIQDHIPRVERMEKQIHEVAKNCPPYFRSDNPDTSFDSHPACAWLIGFRPKIRTEIAFAIMALHRPYIFTKASSRTAALKASLEILQAQRELFSLLHVTHYRMFSLVINTFDAIVVVAAVFIMHPNENRDLLNTALQHFEWGMQRFRMLSGRNTMAKAGLGVLRAIYVRLRKVVSSGKTPYTLNPATQPTSRRSSTQPALSTSSDLTPPAPTPGTFSSRSGSSQHNLSTSQPPTPNGYGPLIPSPITSAPQYTQPTISNLTSPTPPPDPAWERFSGSIPNQPIFGFSSLSTLQPAGDLVLNNLSTIADPQILDPQLGGFDLKDMSVVDSSAWQFEGHFAEDSFWGIMNYYNI